MFDCAMLSAAYTSKTLHFELNTNLKEIILELTYGLGFVHCELLAFIQHACIAFLGHSQVRCEH